MKARVGTLEGLLAPALVLVVLVGPVAGSGATPPIFTDPTEASEAPRLRQPPPDVIAARPAKVIGVGGASAVAVGAAHSCALGQDGRVRCWGANHWGQLGDGTQTHRTTAITLAEPTGVAELALAEVSTCTRTGAGAVSCWGCGTAGALGTGAESDQTRAVAARVPEGVVQLSAGGSHVCARTHTGEVSCWGAGGAGQTGTGRKPRATLEPTRVAGLPTVVEIAAGGHNTCALTSAGELWCWGQGYPTSGPAFTPSPTRLGTFTGAVEVDVTDGHLCLRGRTGEVDCIGAHDGELDGKAPKDPARPRRVRGLPATAQLALGVGFSCVRSEVGEVWCWGDNLDGNLGDGTTRSRPQPRRVPGLDDVRDLDCKDSHCCALRSDGSVRCWGLNNASTRIVSCAASPTTRRAAFTSTGQPSPGGSPGTGASAGSSSSTEDLRSTSSRSEPTSRSIVAGRTSASWVRHFAFRRGRSATAMPTCSAPRRSCADTPAIETAWYSGRRGARTCGPCSSRRPRSASPRRRGAQAARSRQPGRWCRTSASSATPGRASWTAPPAKLDAPPSGAHHDATRSVMANLANRLVVRSEMGQLGPEAETVAAEPGAAPAHPAV